MRMWALTGEALQCNFQWDFWKTAQLTHTDFQDTVACFSLGMLSSVTKINGVGGRSLGVYKYDPFQNTEALDCLRQMDVLG